MTLQSTCGATRTVSRLFAKPESKNAIPINVGRRRRTVRNRRGAFDNKSTSTAVHSPSGGSIFYCRVKFRLSFCIIFKSSILIAIVPHRFRTFLRIEQTAAVIFTGSTQNNFCRFSKGFFFFFFKRFYSVFLASGRRSGTRPGDRVRIINPEPDWCTARTNPGRVGTTRVWFFRSGSTARTRRTERTFRRKKARKKRLPRP